MCAGITWYTHICYVTCIYSLPHQVQVHQSTHHSSELCSNIHNSSLFKNPIIMTVYSGIDCAGVVRMCMYVTFVDLCFSYIVDITISTSICILALIA